MDNETAFSETPSVPFKAIAKLYRFWFSHLELGGDQRDNAGINVNGEFLIPNPSKHRKRCMDNLQLLLQILVPVFSLMLTLLGDVTTGAWER